MNSDRQEEKLKTSQCSKFRSGGATGEVLFENGFIHNFQTVQLIFTSSLPIDSAREVKYYKNLKRSRLENLVEQ